MTKYLDRQKAERERESYKRIQIHVEIRCTTVIIQSYLVHFQTHPVIDLVVPQGDMIFEGCVPVK